MSKKKFRTNYDCPKSVADRTILSTEDRCVPDKTYTIRELLRRSTAGTLPGVAKRPIWDEHPDFDTWDETLQNFDLADAEELARRLEERSAEIEEARDKVKKNERERIRLKMVELEELKKKFKEFPLGMTKKDIEKLDKGD